MSNAGLTPYQPQALSLPTADEWQTITTMAKALAASGLVPSHIKTPEAAVAVILQGRELGIGPMQALRTIFLVTGKLTLSADLMAALIWRACGDNAMRIIERTATVCSIDYQRPGWDAPARMSWTIEQARAAGLSGKDTWKQYPDAMLYARCVSSIAHTAFQDVIMGLYTPDEMESIDDGDRPPVTASGGATIAPLPAANLARPEPVVQQTTQEPDAEVVAARAALRAAVAAQGWSDRDVIDAAASVWPHITSGSAVGTLTAFQLGRLTEVVTGECVIAEDNHGHRRIMPAPEPETTETPMLIEQIAAAVR